MAAARDMSRTNSNGSVFVSILISPRATLRELGWPPAAEANPHDIPGLIAAVLTQF